MFGRALLLCSILSFSIQLTSEAAWAQSRQKPAAGGAKRGIAQQPKPKHKGIFEPVNFDQPIELRTVFFIDAENGWAAGANGTIIRTRDAGKTWEAQMGGDPENAEQRFDRLYFLDRRQGWVVGPAKSVVQQKLYATSDGGETWRVVGTIGTELGSYTDYAFTSAANGVFLSGGTGSTSGIWLTQDGGKKWREVLPKCEVQTEIEGQSKRVACRLASVRFVSQSVGYAAGAAPGGTAVVMKTQNGGASWDYVWVQPEIGHPDENHFRQSIFFVDERNGYLVLPRAQKVLATTDGGESWEELTATAKGELRFADPEVGWIMEGGKWSFTTDGGKKWNSRELRFPTSPNAFSLPTRQRGYVVGSGGMVYRYSVVPADYSAAGSIDVPAMTSAGAVAIEQRLSKVKTGASALRAKLAAAQKGKPAAKSSAATSSGSPGKAKSKPVSATGSAATSATSDEQSEEPAAEEPASAGGETEAAGESGAGESAGEAEEGGGFVQDCCAEQLQEVESSVESATAELPKFTGKFRNLNLLSVGLKMFQDVMNQGKELKAALAELRGAKDADAAMAALNKLTGSVDNIAKSVASGTGGGSAEEE